MKSDRSYFTLGFLAAVLLAIPGSLSAATVLYSTGFEPSEGYNPQFELIGQKGWVSDTTTLSGGNGLLTNFLGSQAAYVGLFPLNPLDSYLAVWQPINWLPLVPPAMPLMKFSATMAIIDSTNGFRDDFFWNVYNIQGNYLFTLDFYNKDLGIYYALNDTNGFVFTGATFSNDVPYTVAITMDFARNLWSATLNGATVVSNKRITTMNSPLNLGDVDAVWSIVDTNNIPGDNFMIFDNYLITADAEPPASVSTFGLTASGQFLLRVYGPSGSRYSVDASTDLRQWSALKTNVVTDGSFDYVDTSAGGFSTRYYRARLVP